ncbi:MAG TPA: NAD(P)/FAD-dependent oxidoreductase [Tepidisphaeraceae bacterium]|jgi:NADH dehydrogenase
MEPKRIVILGGGFGGLYTAWHLQRIWKRDPTVEITLVSRTNYFLMTPLLFEAGSGVLEPRHAVSPIRKMLTSARLVQGEIERIDLDGHKVRVRFADDEARDLPYDHLVLALGGVTNTKVIPGADTAMQFKTLADAIALRNHVIERFERADVETHPEHVRAQLTFVVAGAGLVGTELMGELTDFVEHVTRTYPRIDHKLCRFELIEYAPRIIPEFDEGLANYAADVLRARGVNVRVNTKVDAIHPDAVHLAGGEKIEAATIVLATGVAPNPLLGTLELPKDKRGKIQVDATMRVKERPEVWALGDCASIPDPNGKPYPPLAQHAIREARTLAENITSAIHSRPLQPFVYQSQGSLAALGHYRGVGRVWGIKIKGFPAWWVWRTYYLFRMPRWERRLRIMIDWAVALFFKNDVVELDLDRREERS